METASGYIIHFPDYYDELTEIEVCAKGWFAGVKVELPDGTQYPVFFYDPVRLGQDLTADAKQGRPVVAEPGLVVVPEVTRAAILEAIERLVKHGYFQHLQPLASTQPLTPINGSVQAAPAVSKDIMTR